ncbi:MAG: ATP-binding protein [Bacteroidetes bacterium]|nr:ATP-binding protein [Bacteroidota bacterium]
METVLARYNPWWDKNPKPENYIVREEIISQLLRQIDNNLVVFITGLRRVGKTTLMKMLVHHLLAVRDIAPEKILYVSLDDYLLLKKTILEIIEEFRKIHRLSFREKIWLFLDEISYKEDFELQLKNLADSHNVKIFTTSSSATLLTKRKHLLTGRSFTFEVNPLNFSEYLLFKSMKISKEDHHLNEKLFEDYLKTGGIPEYVLRGDPAYLHDLVDDIIYKDIAAVNNIRHPEILRDMFILLMERSGKTVSINKLARILNITPDTSKRFLEFFRNTFLIFLVPRFGKPNERLLSPKKLYAADLGIRNFFTGFRDMGSLFENFVFLMIRNQKPSFILKDGIEIDFYTENKTLIEAKYHQEPLSEKQQMLFDQFKASEKVIIRSPQEIDHFLS